MIKRSLADAMPKTVKARILDIIVINILLTDIIFVINILIISNLKKADAELCVRTLHNKHCKGQISNTFFC